MFKKELRKELSLKFFVNQKILIVIKLIKEIYNIIIYMDIEHPTMKLKIMLYCVEYNNKQQYTIINCIIK